MSLLLPTGSKILLILSFFVVAYFCTSRDRTVGYNDKLDQRKSPKHETLYIIIIIIRNSWSHLALVLWCRITYDLYKYRTGGHGGENVKETRNTVAFIGSLNMD